MTEIDDDDNISNLDIKPSVADCGDSARISTLPKIVVLIKLIANEPAIFNLKHEDHRNAVKKEEMWNALSKEVGWTVKHCKNKWKALRDQYCRELKRTRINSKAIIKWKYFSHLEFLRPFALSRNYRPKKSPGSEESDGLLEQQDDPLDDRPNADEFTFTVKSENWTFNTNEPNTTPITEVTNHDLTKLGNIVDEDQNDDEDDDPIHTFLNIESYFEKELIAMVQLEEILYNQKHPSYKNVKLKLVVWEEIARKLKRTVKQCRLKWKALRNQYIREHKRLLQLDDKKYSGRWKHYEALSFLKSFLRRRRKNYHHLVETQNTEIDMSAENIGQESMITQSTESDQDMSQYIIGDTDPTLIYSECQSIQPTPYPKNEATPMEPLPATSTPESFPTSAPGPPPSDDNDEIGAFFRAVAMKIRKAKMSAMAFTELQIDILRVITNVLRDYH